MLSLLALHALAAPRGDGLKPELLALLRRQAQAESGLTARIGSPTDAVPTVPVLSTESTIADDVSSSAS